MVDKQIAKSLDRIHRDVAGLSEPCRWNYHGVSDEYWCRHITVSGRRVIDNIENNFVQEAFVNVH